MEKIDVSPDSARHFLHPSMVVLATSVDEEDNPNIITLAWAMPTSFSPPLVAISVGKKRYSHSLIKNAEEFVLNVPSQELLDEVQFCGSHSGSGTDKFEETSLTQEDSVEVEVPRIKECAANLECELLNELDTGDHTIFVGEIVAASADREKFDRSSGRFDMGQFRPIFHAGGPVFVTSGEELG